MSNVIKAYSVRYDDEAIKTLDTHLRIDKEIEEKRNAILPTLKNYNDGFVEGLQALVVETLPSQEEIAEQNAKITEEAKNEANHILEQAKKEAEQMKSNVYAAAQKKGYEDGIIQSQKETQKIRTEYDVKAQELQKDYEDLLESLEPQMVQLVSALVEKITGIMVQDKEEVIFYLISKAIKNIDKNDEYTIRISKEDFEYVSVRRNLLLSAIGREVPLYIIEDSNLKKNQCLIETELKVINCSLDIQLNNLISDLKLISGI